MKHVSFGLSINVLRTFSTYPTTKTSEEGDELLNCINDFRHSLQSKDLIALDKEANRTPETLKVCLSFVFVVFLFSGKLLDERSIIITYNLFGTQLW